MGNFANTLFSSLLGWLRGAVLWLWNYLNHPESGGFIVWVADNWLTLIILLCAVGMLADFIVYMIRWQPYKVWASFFRRLTGRGEAKEDTGRIRRRWIHADGTTSIEEIPVNEVAPEPEPAFVYTPEPTPADLSARFARPQEEFTPPPLPVTQPEPMPEPPAEAPERPVRVRRRRFTGDTEELPLRYAPPPAAAEEAPAYHEPYVPPQWKRPADTGSSGVDLGGSGL